MKPNGKDSAWFEFVGEDYSCGFSTEVGSLGLSEDKEKCLNFYGYAGHHWKVYPLGK